MFRQIFSGVHGVPRGCVEFRWVFAVPSAEWQGLPDACGLVDLMCSPAANVVRDRASELELIY